MPANGKHQTAHEIEIEAPSERVYRLIADAADWPQRFEPTIHVERTALEAGSERLRIWATANGEVRSWTSLRELDPEGLRISFRQEVSTHPVAAMGGEWIIVPLDADRSRLTLLHDFDAVDDTPENVAWVSQATDRNSKAELANIKHLAETWDRHQELVFSFEDSVLIRGTLTETYDFLYQAALWHERLPHVGRLDLREDVENVQWMSMETVTKDGSSHVTESVRICSPSERIVYKQLVPPLLMTAHLGVWSFEETPDGVRASSSHTVTVNEATVVPVLGADATVETAKQFIRGAAGGNSVATLTLAKKFVESLHDGAGRE